MSKIALAFVFLLLTLGLLTSLALGQESCLYLTRDNTIKNAKSLSAVPPEYREQARCFPGKKQDFYLAKPNEIELKGPVLADQLSSPVGPIRLRGARSIQRLFGRTPIRAMNEAAQAVNRALKQGPFPEGLRTLNLEWNVVFLDEKLPETQIPAQLISNCHPGWMTAPANIYIVAQRVAAGCSAGQKRSIRDADAEMMRVLLHEMGHAVEAQLLGPLFEGDRMRAEGFAVWFEGYASSFSPLGKGRDSELQYQRMAKSSFEQSPKSFHFSGSPEDYARAGTYFKVIVQQRGMRALLDVYRAMKEEQLSFSAAIEKKIGWKAQKLNEQALLFIDKGLAL